MCVYVCVCGGGRLSRDDELVVHIQAAFMAACGVCVCVCMTHNSMYMQSNQWGKLLISGCIRCYYTESHTHLNIQCHLPQAMYSPRTGIGMIATRSLQEFNNFTALATNR